MGSKSTSIEVPDMNIAHDIKRYISGVSASMPTVMRNEQAYRPKFQGLNLGDINAFLNGVGGQQGILGMGGAASRQSADLIGGLRATEIGQMTDQAGMARGMFNALSPEGAAQVANANAESQRAYASAGGLTAQENRMATQQARESFASRGMLGSNSSVVGEAMNRDSYLVGKRNEAAQRGAQAYDMANSFYTQPGMSLLGGLPLSYQAGQQQLQAGFGAIGAGVPQLYNLDQGMNLGASQRANLVGAQSASAQANAGRSAGMWGGIGAALGGILGGPLGSAVGAGIGSAFKR